MTEHRPFSYRSSDELRADAAGMGLLLSRSDLTFRRYRRYAARKTARVTENCSKRIGKDKFADFNRNTILQ